MIWRFLEKFSTKSKTLPLLTLGDSIISDCYPGPGRGVAALLAARLAVPTLGVCRTGYVLADIEAQWEGLPAQPCRAGLLSVGGNDLLGLDRVPEPSDPWFAEFGRRYRELLRELRQRFPGPWLICNLYDPSDGSGQFPGRAERGWPPRPELVTALRELNEVIAREAGPDLVDLYGACSGHGWSRQRELWFQMDIEPNRLGAERICELLYQRLAL